MLWLKSYLTDRKQNVKINDFFSKFINVACGVSQGLHLGPLLFNLYINDIYKVFRYSCLLLLADDFKLYRIIKNKTDSVLLQKDLDALLSWWEENEQTLNIAKCKILKFSRKKKAMPLMILNWNTIGLDWIGSIFILSKL